MKSQKLLLCIIFFYINGIFSYFSLPINIPYYIFISIFLLALLIYTINKKILVIVIALSFIAGFYASKIKTEFLVNTHYINKNISTYIVGTILSVENKNNGVQLVLSDVKADDIEQKLDNIRILAIASKQIYNVGDVIRVYADLSPPPPPLLAFGYDFQRQLYFQKISALGFTYLPAEILEKSTKQPIIWNRTKNYLEQKFDTFFDNDTKSVAKAIFLGDTSEITDSTRKDYQISGISHILSISGLHVSIIAAFFFFVIRSLLALFPIIALKYNTKKFAVILSFFMLTFYVLLAGAPITAVRSLIMISVAMIAIVMDKKVLSISNVAITAFIILLFSPNLLFSISFQLSFIAIIAIILANSYIKSGASINSFIPKTIDSIIKLGIITVIIELAMIPLISYYFGSIPVYGLITNLIAIPLVSFITMPFGIIAISTSVAEPIASIPFLITNYSIKALNFIAAFMANLPLSFISVSFIPPHIIFLFFIIVFLLILFPKYKKYSLSVIALIIIVIIFFPKPLILANPSYKTFATYIDNSWVLSNKTHSNFLKSQLGRYDYISKTTLPDHAYCKIGNKECIIRTNNGSILFILSEDIADSSLCNNIALVIRVGSGNLCKGIKTIDSDYLSRNGAVFVYSLPFGLVIVDAKTITGNKYWNK